MEGEYLIPRKEFERTVQSAVGYPRPVYFRVKREYRTPYIKEKVEVFFELFGELLKSNEPLDMISSTGVIIPSRKLLQELSDALYAPENGDILKLFSVVGAGSGDPIAASRSEPSSLERKVA